MVFTVRIIRFSQINSFVRYYQCIYHTQYVYRIQPHGHYPFVQIKFVEKPSNAPNAWGIENLYAMIWQSNWVITKWNTSFNLINNVTLIVIRVVQWMVVADGYWLLIVVKLNKLNKIYGQWAVIWAESFRAHLSLLSHLSHLNNSSWLNIACRNPMTRMGQLGIERNISQNLSNRSTTLVWCSACLTNLNQEHMPPCIDRFDNLKIGVAPYICSPGYKWYPHLFL